MIFCTLSFFTKFAQMLMLTIAHSIIGSFILYLVLTDLFGPANPTKLFDEVVAKISCKKDEESKSNSSNDANEKYVNPDVVMDSFKKI